MADIKLTLSKDTCISREADYMEREKGLAYPLGKRPGRLNQAAGCISFFATTLSLVPRQWSSSSRREGQFSTTMVKNIWRRPGWWVKCTDMELPLRREGFRGFRYVREDEQERFEEAFAWPEE